MGSNSLGQLGIDDPYTAVKSSPVLLESLVNMKPLQVACGGNHTLAVMKSGEVYSWGNNENGQCGTGSQPFHNMVHWSPRVVRFDDYFKPNIRFANCG
mmetsp:Transcript_2263/g.2201  ORF Transcript_2263/g.2201 Transcript_2263/m.2201 type:complete len:98 (+) Transcript_2263:315-608(+)